MEITNTIIPGCYQIFPDKYADKRGTFIKTFHEGVFAANGLETDFAEEFFSTSCRGVLRGLHFQLPPAEHVKLVYCISGKVFDVVVDLRVGSPAYGKAYSIVLDSENLNMLYVPKGLAHGFCALTDEATMMYKVSTVHDVESDSGIYWKSVNVDWPVENPILSDRDLNFKNLEDFQSPFVY